MKNIGFIGLGIMGKPMAKNLLKAGYPVIVYDIVEESVHELIEAGAQKGTSSEDVASQSNVIITMLPDSPEVQDAVLGEGGVIQGVKSGSILIDMSSINPKVSQEISKELEQKDVVMFDAPVSGGEPKATDGSLAIMVGGPQQTFEEVKPVLEVMGSSVTYIGEIGSGNICKLANQVIVALNIAGMGEAMVLATKAGVDPENIFNAIRGGLAGSAVLDAKMPMVLDGNFKPGGKIETHTKDLRNVLDTAKELEVPVFLTSQVMEIMQALKVDGKSKNDHGGLVQFFEKLANVEVRRK
ncbi:MAG: 2-hydroxy-3-oxopropionate reductase [Bacteroidales bacterium]|nr:2-hydroxy-3-oxopropionate reductase [Bacteroidales bacterium]